MATEVFANNFSVQLAVGCLISDVTIRVTLPAPVALQTGGQFRVLVDNEVMIVTAGAGTTTWTVVRGAEVQYGSGPAVAHQQGSWVTHLITAGMLQAIGVTTGLDQRYILAQNPQTVSGTFRADAIEATGVPGLTSPLTLRGQLLSAGPPVSGAWNSRDMIVDTLNNIWVCTAGGQPGSWSSGASGTTGPPTSAPVASTLPATLIDQQGAQLNGQVSPGNLTTTYQFEYGFDTTYGAFIPANPIIAGGDAVVHQVAQEAAVLAGATTYHYRLDASNSLGNVLGNDQTFTTLAPNVAPTVTSPGTSGPSSTGQTLQATVDANGASSSYQFQYGSTTGYGANLPVTPAFAGASTLQIVETQPLTGLAANTLYHWQLLAANANGSTSTGDQTFTTLAAAAAPTIASQFTTAIGQNSAILNTDMIPNAANAAVQFQYGSTTGYGGGVTSTATTSIQGLQFVSWTTQPALAAATLYHWRTLAWNVTGSTAGADQTFTTSGVSAPTVVTGSAPNLTTTSVQLTGTVNPNGNATTWQYQYGSDTTYGRLIPDGQPTAGAGNTPVLETANLTGLQPGTNYHYRITATNSGGTVRGADQTFTTQATVAVAPVNFARLTYGNSFPNAFASDVANGIQIYILGIGASSTGYANAMRQAAAAQGQPMAVLGYTAADTVNSAQTGAYDGGPVSYATALANGYLTKDANGYLCYPRSYPGDRYVTVTDAGFQAATIAHMKAKLSTGGFDGVFWDGCDSSVSTLRVTALVGSTPNTTTDPATTLPWGSTSTNVENGIAAFLKAVVPSLNTAGYVCVGNTGNLPINPGESVPAPQHFAPILNGTGGGGVYFESWCDGGVGLLQQMQTTVGGIPGTINNMNMAIAIDSQGIQVLCCNQNTTSAGQIFGLAVMMLCTTGYCYYMDDHLTGDYWATAGNYASFSKALGSGPAIDPVVTPGTPNGTGANTGLYVRRFTNCTVRVNLGTGTAAINGLNGLANTSGPYASIA